jgi:hypothetical protein
MDIHLLLGLVVMFPLMKAMQSLLKFVWRKDTFIYDFIDVLKVYQGQVYLIY